MLEQKEKKINKALNHRKYCGYHKGQSEKYVLFKRKPSNSKTQEEKESIYPYQHGESTECDRIKWTNEMVCIFVERMYLKANNKIELW